MNSIKKIFYGFWQTLGFLTTLPLPSAFFSKQYNLMSPGAMAVAGLGIGAVVGGLLVGLLALQVFHIFAVLAAIVTGVLLTGCLHEDGFADFCDGYFGKRDPERILSIMKDSHIGSFGVVGLIILFYTRFTALVLMYGWQLHYIFLALVLSAALSRLAMTAALFLPLEKKGQSSLHHVARPNFLSLLVPLQVLWLVAFFPKPDVAARDMVVLGDSVGAQAPWGIMWWHLPVTLCLVLAGSLLVFFLLHRQKKLPLTGDSLGFLQVVSEVILWCFFLNYFGFQQ
ncbi:MAG: adenosylcobinamide-GDP ribazoletransferase [Hydrotalea sp.]|nr:adenosylcobinamide-GDP ribazoletransferase [Hydrotalea sp.]